ncbi:excinuclease ABC subunit UvrB [bacterium]|nr:excinuclease ABC subunit UvrB [bacterium]
MSFHLQAPFQPAGDQPGAIKTLIERYKNGSKHELLMGATGSGKTFVMAHIINELQLPTLVMAHNKTLAGQLYGEFKQFFPEDKVGYFISFYDYYQPEAYMPSSDTYIEKDAQRNDDIDRMRHFATASLLESKASIIIASVSCIYGIGSPDAYQTLALTVGVGQEFAISKLTRRLVEMQYKRTKFDLNRGTFRVQGESVEIFPPYEENAVIKLLYFDDEIEEISIVTPFEQKKLRSLTKITVYPSSHYVAKKETLKKAVTSIEAELEDRLVELTSQSKLVEEQRLRERVTQDVAMISNTGWCSGIENYSRYLTEREQGEAPPTLMDYFGKDFLTIIDESHATIPQVHGMYKGDRSRKTVLVDYGFRLPSALDNRPLNFEEFEQRADRLLFVSATPRDYEKEKSGETVELINRPTGLVDPEIEVKPAKNEIELLYDEIQKEQKHGGKVLVTALTKKMAEDLSDFLIERSVRAKYLHSDIDAIDRLRIVMELRKDMFDVLVGVNLLREGLDIPEVTLVAILDADKEGFLRNTTSLIQTIGRAARNVDGRVILFADKMTNSMKLAIDETDRRRNIQKAYNKKHGITPVTISRKNIVDIDTLIPGKKEGKRGKQNRNELVKQIKDLETEMKKASREWNFEYAAVIRDKIIEYKAELGPQKRR